MVVFVPGMKVVMSFTQGNNGSEVPIDIGSCLSAYDEVKPEDVDVTLTRGMNSLPFRITESKGNRITVCGSGTATLRTNGSSVGYLTFEVLHDKDGPDGISQLSAQVVARDVSGNAVDKRYAPKELHRFDLNKGPISIGMSVNGSLLYNQIVEPQPSPSGTKINY